MNPLERLLAQAAGAGKVLGSVDDPVRGACPILWSFLSTVDTGTHLKEPARLTLTLVPGGVLVTLGDGDLGVSLDASCVVLGDVFAAIETVLSGPTPPFREWRQHEVRLRKKRPKKDSTSE